jgi:AraC family transcriptional regulator, positive regulator of tynA and feaB
MLVFSSATHRPDEAFELWRVAVCSQFMPLRPERTADSESFVAELHGYPVADLALSDVRASGHRIHRGRQELAGSQADLLFLNVQVAGESGLVCNDVATCIRRGDLFIVDGRRPFVLDCSTPARHLCTAIPRTALQATIRESSFVHGLVLRADDSFAGLLRDYTVAVASAADSLQSAANDVAEHLTTLVGHALARRMEDRQPPLAAVRAALFARARRAIDRRLSDPEFDPRQLARDVGVSLRYLQALMAERGTSPMREIIQRRTAVAMRLLREPANAHRTITEIALSCGFRDVTHFGRLIVTATGRTPRAWRTSAHD